MTLRLRPHHLLCMLTYVGKGYTPGFVANYDRLAARISEGEVIEVVSGPDDMCQPLLCEQAPHCHDASVLRRDARALSDVTAMLGRPVQVGTRLLPDAHLIARLRAGFRAGLNRTACQRCDWQSFCTEVADGGFAGCRVSGRNV